MSDHRVGYIDMDHLDSFGDSPDSDWVLGVVEHIVPLALVHPCIVGYVHETNPANESDRKHSNSPEDALYPSMDLR